MKKPTLRLLFVLIPVLAIAAYFFFRKSPSSTNQENVIVKVTEAPLIINIHAPGELQARKSEKIKGPDGLRTVGIYQLSIQNLVPEGTVVQEGQFVASLDRTELDSKIKDAQTEIDKIVTQLDQAKIDTAIEMRELRDQLINIKFSMEEKQLTLELSKYEPQAIKQEAQLDLERAQREMDQLESKLKLTKDKSIAKIEEINASYRQQDLKINRFLDLQGKMNVTAPKSGMVIYINDWNGKRGPGSQISTWDPTIAELPDLSEMVTKAYINEVDITKVMLGQKARITLDAFPGKEFYGKVISKANIGEQVRNFDTKVFEVIVLLNSIDSLLRPAMTTGLDIKTDSVPNCLQVPLEAIQTDSVSFVFKKSKSGFVRQEVVIGPSNDLNISVAAGLAAGDEVSLNAPADGDKIPFVYLDSVQKQNAKAEVEKSLAERLRAQQEIAKTIKAETASQDNGGGDFFIMF